MELLDTLAYLILTITSLIIIVPILDAIGGGDRETGAYIIGAFFSIIGIILSLGWALDHLSR